MDDDELTALRKARNDAFAEFRAKPTAEGKVKYLASQSAYGSALAVAGVENDRSWSSPISGLPQEVDDARLAANAARREVYANPNPETQAALRAAESKYGKLRRLLDPDAKAKMTEANAKRWAKIKEDPVLLEKRLEAIRTWKAKQKAKKAASQ